MTLIPPAMIEIQGSDRQFLQMVADIKAILGDLAGNVTNVQLGGDTGLLVNALAQAKALTTDFGAQVTNTQLGADDGLLISKLAQARVALNALGKQATTIDPKVDIAEAVAQIKGLQTLLSNEDGTLDLNLDIKPALLEIAELRGALSLLKLDEVVVDLNSRGAIEQVTALQAYIDSRTASITVNADINNSEIAAKLASVDATIAAANADSLLKSLTQDAAAGAAGSGSGGKGGLLATLLTGGGGALGLPAGGSLLSFAGLSVDHLIFTSGALAGSAIGGLLGGGLLAGGAAGVAGVGIGTDLAGIGQAGGDIKNVVGAMNNLSSAQAEYGRTSKEATDAFNLLTQAEDGFNPVAKQAVINAANAIQSFKSMFDQYTGEAEKLGANLITMFVKGATPYLPVIGEFAAKNMQTLINGLQPLVTWLDGPGLKIFTQLENQFSKQLPTGTNAFVQGLEAVIKAVGLIAPQTGGFLTSLSNFFTNLNKELSNPKSVDSGKIDNLIKDFRNWSAFFKILFKDIDQLFTVDDKSHTATAIIKRLTTFLTEFNQFENSLSGKSDLGNLFAVHKGEILAILDTLPPMAKAFGGLYEAIAPIAVTTITLFFKGLAAGIGALDKVKIGKLDIGAIAVGIGIVATKLGLLHNVLGPLVKDLSGLALTGLASLFKGTALGDAFAKILGKLFPASATTAFATSVSEFSAAVTRFGGESTVAGAGGAATSEEAAAAGIGTKIAAGFTSALAAGTLSVALIKGSQLLISNVPVLTNLFNELNKNHAPVTPSSVKTALTTNPLGGAGSALPEWERIGLTQAQYETLLKQIGGSSAASRLASATGTTDGDTNQTPSQLAKDFLSLGVSASTVSQITGLNAKAVATISASLAKSAKTGFTQAGTDAVLGFSSGIKGSTATSSKSATDLGNASLTALRNAIKAKSPSQEALTIGKDFVSGYTSGISGSEASATKAITAFGNKGLADLKAMAPLWKSEGVTLVQALISGVTSQSSALQRAVTSATTVHAAASGGGATRSSASGATSLTVYLGGITIIGATGSQSQIEQSVLAAVQQANQQILSSLRAGAGGPNG